jgi:hypothetical protein
MKDLEDVCIWPNGFWCYKYELHDTLFSRPDDYTVLKFDSKDYNEFFEKLLEEKHAHPTPAYVNQG